MTDTPRPRDEAGDTASEAASEDARTALVVGTDRAAEAAAAALGERGYAVVRLAEDDAESETRTEAGDGPNDADCAVVSEASVPLDSAAFDALSEELPVVLLGATSGATAAEAMAAGAAEFVGRGDDDAPDGRVLDARVSGVVAREEAETLRRRCDRLASERFREQSMVDTIFENIPAHLYVKDEEARHVRVSDAYVDDPEKYIGKRDVEIHSHDHARETYEDDMRVIGRGEPIFDKEERVVSSDTDEFSVRHLLSEHGEEADLAESWVLTSKVPWRDDDGEVLGLVGFTIDISARNEYRQRLERQNDRLEEFAGVVSHDLRNPLNVARGYLELLADAVEGETAEGYVERIDRAHERMDELIEDVLSLARQGNVVSDPERTPLADAARRAWETVAAGDGGELDVRTDGATVLADGGRLRELLENLFSNSLEHGRGSDGAGDGKDNGDDVVVTVGLLDDDGFYVEDDGPGIPASDREDVFEPGETTAADGTGFGLAIVRRIAEAHDWGVALTAAEDGGARFEFRGCDVRRD